MVSVGATLELAADDLLTGIIDCVLDAIADRAQEATLTVEGTFVPLVALRPGVLLKTGAMAEGNNFGVLSRPISREAFQFSAVWSPRNDNTAFRRFLRIAKALSNLNSISDRDAD